MSPRPLATRGFEVVKWYLDAVEPDGTVTIAYWASLSWLGINARWQNITRYAAGEPPVERSSMRRVHPPVVTDRSVTWQSPPLGLSTRHDATTQGISITLFDGPTGQIVWECVAPSARATFDRGDAAQRGVAQGAGYAERISITVPPNELPIHELRWGRWMSDDLRTAVVWIDWRGPLPRRWVIVNGDLVGESKLVDTDLQTDRGHLALGAPRTLHQRSVGNFLRTLSGLSRLAAHIPLAWDEHKMSCRAMWTEPLGMTVEGWAVHETVRFR